MYRDAKVCIAPMIRDYLWQNLPKTLRIASDICFCMYRQRDVAAILYMHVSIPQYFGSSQK